MGAPLRPAPPLPHPAAHPHADRTAPAGPRPHLVDLAAVARFLGVAVDPGDAAGVPVAGVSDDSRAVRPGDLYVALPGTQVHGLDFVREAAARGAVAVLSDRPAGVLPTVVVPDPRRVVGPLASWLHGTPDTRLDVHGVTGTNGKTSATYLLDAALRGSGTTSAMITGITVRGPRGSRPATRTTPEAVALQGTLAGFAADGAAAVAMEVSSHAISQHRVAGTRFRSVAFTNLGRDHLDFHGTMEQYYRAKAALFVPGRADVAVVNLDDEHGRRLAATTELPCWTHSTVDPRADVLGEDVVSDHRGTTFTARTPSGPVPVRLPLLGPHQAQNALTALTTLAATGHDVARAADALAGLAVVPGRLERVDAGQPFLALVDYMHNPHSQAVLLPYLRGLVPGRVLCVVGATGGRDPGKRFPMGAQAGAWCDVVVVADESPEGERARDIRDAVAAGARSAGHARVVVEPDRRAAIDHAVRAARPGDVVVVAGRGCDTVQRHGAETRHFDDREHLRASLRARHG